MRREAYDAKLNPKLVDAVMEYRRARTHAQWLAVAFQYIGDPAGHADVVENTVRHHARITAVPGGGAA